MQEKQKKFIPALTGYRTIAAWMIFVYHFMPYNNPKYPQWIKDFVLEFHIGVDMFFVLSGFLITYRYYKSIPINFRNYLVNRCARIYPMYFLITLAFFIVLYFQNSTWSTENTIEAILSFTMAKAVFYKYQFTGVAQGWTLTLEEMFYFTAPFYFLLIKKNIKWVFIIPMGIFLFGTFLQQLFNVPENTWGFMTRNISIFIFEFFAGIGLALLIMNRNFNFRIQWVTWFGFANILIFLVFVKYYYLTNVYYGWLFVVYLSIFGIACFLWGLIHEKTIFQKLLGSKLFVLLGKSSYIFYLIHKGFIPVFINDYISDNILINFILLNLISILLFLYLEEPINNFIREKFGKNSSHTPKSIE